MAKVLLVEDDNNLREIYQARLVAEGYDIVAAQNGEEALVVAKQNKPDLIISDVMMPRISGFEMLDILRNTEGLKNTKVIMLTALGQAEDQKRAGNLGADKYLVKSQVTLEDIVNAAAELLKESGATSTETTAPAVEVAPTVVPETSTEVAAAPAQPITPDTAAEPIVSEPVPAPEPQAAAVPVVEPPVAVQPVTSAVTDPSAPVATDATVVPASVVPQPNTTVVVPPAPADPTPPTTTVTPLPAESSVTVPADTAGSDVAAPSIAVPTTAVEAAEPLAQEEAAIQAQIADYSQQPAETPPAVTAEAASNDETLADAVEALNTPSVESPVQPPSVTNAPVPLVDTSEAAPAAEPAAGDPTTPVGSALNAPSDVPDTTQSVAGKKVIQPIGTVTKPNLDELLAKEEAKDILNTPTAAVVPAPQPEPAATPEPVTPPAVPPAPVAPAAPPVQPAPAPAPVSQPPATPADPAAAPAAKPFDPNTAL